MISYNEKVIRGCIIQPCINFYYYAEALGKCDKQCKGCKEEINGQQLELL